MTPSRAPVSLVSLFLVFFRVGLFSFGGGLSGWIYREVVTLRGWMSDDDFFSGLALSQILPGDGRIAGFQPSARLTPAWTVTSDGT
jgi:chromate transporter